MKEREGLGKFDEVDIKYFEYVDKLEKMNFSARDLMFNFPVFAGHVNIGRYLFFYDLYKQVLELNGNIADVGTYKGASFIFFAKLIKLFELYNETQVHGFDWFEGMKPGQNDNMQYKNTYIADYNTLKNLIDIQNLADVAILHKIDLIKETEKFFEKRPQLRFKLIFIDCGIEKVLESCVPLFWSRLVKGGIIIFDHFNCEDSPEESRIVESIVGNNLIKQMSFNRQPTAYVVKER